MRASTQLNVLIFEKEFKRYLIRPGNRVDSLIIIDNKFSRFKEFKPREPMEDSILVYYTEYTGSVCCPRDAKYDRESLRDFIKRYERDNNIKIRDAYTRSIGKEGESVSYLTLEGLPPQEKIKFMKERWWSLVPNKHWKDFVEMSFIYIPIVVGKEGLKKID